MKKYGLEVKLELAPGNAQEASDLITKKLLPLHKEAWDTEKRQVLGRDYDPNITALMQMWVSGALKIVLLSTEEDETVGYVLCAEFRPLAYNARVLQVEDYYVRPHYRHQGMQAINELVVEMATMCGCHELWTTEQGGDYPLTIDPTNWAERQPFAKTRQHLAR